jgi:guanylate kinase
LLAGTTAAIVVLIIFLLKWSNTLQREVKRRTKELESSLTRLEQKEKELNNQMSSFNQLMNN